ncbi:MAG: beta-ketoacyl synthase N-terminal-like domain-containing protein [Campylobacterota bacterium]|nr:beta-ketoacyl synthase N-terminal-like domain-containing protein [Campylobacterota bacterium]
MAKINILDYEIYSSSGDLKDTLQAIKTQTTGISSKTIKIDTEEISLPFFAFKDEVEQNQKSIKDSLRDMLQKSLSKLTLHQKKSTSLIIGTSLIDWYLVDAINDTAYEYKKTPYYSQKHSIDSYAKELAEEFGLNEFTMTINTACTSSANALLEASNLINCGVVDYALVVGLEIYSPIMSSGFYSMNLISTDFAKPFDKDRDGLVLGEGIGVMLLGQESSKWSLEGGFSNCNSATITSVSESGDECVEVMLEALESADVKAKDITALKAHATGSHSNDLAEIRAISRVFDSSLVFTALKPYIGHTIGASGVLEISLLMAAIDSGFIPKTISCSESILEDFVPLCEDKECESGLFMCNYFGFGGNNISLIIRRDAV